MAAGSFLHWDSCCDWQPTRAMAIGTESGTDRFRVGAWKQIFVIRQLVDEEVAIWERRRRCLQHL